MEVPPDELEAFIYSHGNGDRDTIQSIYPIYKRERQRVKTSSDNNENVNGKDKVIL